MLGANEIESFEGREYGCTKKGETEDSVESGYSKVGLERTGNFKEGIMRSEVKEHRFGRYSGDVFSESGQYA